MEINFLLQSLTNSHSAKKLFQNIEKNNICTLSGVVGSAISILISEVYKKQPRTILFICDDKEEAAYFLNDLEKLIGQANVLFFPSSYRRAYQIEATDNANVLLRAEVLSRLSHSQNPLVVVTYTEALFEKVISKKELEKNTLSIAVGDAISLDFLNETLFEYHFHRVDFVTEPGEFSVRGGIVDVFSFSNDMPYLSLIHI